VADAIHTLLCDAALYGKVSENNLAKAQQYDWDVIAKEFMSEVYDRPSG
jgi:glycosyltransferase involved in cell wall biosynthesis